VAELYDSSFWELCRTFGKLVRDGVNRDAADEDLAAAEGRTRLSIAQLSERRRQLVAGYVLHQWLRSPRREEWVKDRIRELCSESGDRPGYARLYTVLTTEELPAGEGDWPDPLTARVFRHVQKRAPSESWAEFRRAVQADREPKHLCDACVTAAIFHVKDYRDVGQWWSDELGEQIPERTLLVQAVSTFQPDHPEYALALHLLVELEDQEREGHDGR
jgi:hypothetical protein